MKLFTRIKASILWIVILLPFASFGQNMAPLGTLPMQYNSSFAGSNGGPRISAFSGYERFKFYKTNYYELYTSYDQFIPALRSGIGITAHLSNYYAPARSILQSFSKMHTRSNGISVAIAPKFSLKGKYTISPSLDFSYEQNAYSALEINFADSVQLVPAWKTSNLQSRVGILFNTNKLYIGYSAYLMDRFIYDNKFLRRWGKNYYTSYLQLGYTFQRSFTSAFSFTPQLVFHIGYVPNPSKAIVSLEAFNLTFRYKKFIWGFNNVGMELGESNNPSYRITQEKFQLREFKNGSIHLGWQNERIKLMLSTNIGFLSRPIYYYEHYTTSLSFRYLIPSKLEKKYTVPGQ